MRFIRFIDPELNQPRYGRIHSTTPDWVDSLYQAPWLGLQPAGIQFPLAELKLLTPCQPSKIVCIGKNYRDHIAEMAAQGADPQIPKEPLLFFKPPSAVLDPQSPIHHPLQSQRVDYEGELALVMGAYCRRVDPAEALDYVFGYTIANDVTARDLQRQDQQWTRAKGFDTFCPVGPWIVRGVDPAATLVTYLNGKQVQSSTLDQMIVSPAELIAYISQAMTLAPGDLVLTGTPEGVGPLQPGDQISIEIAGIGTLTNPVILEPTLD